MSGRLDRIVDAVTIVVGLSAVGVGLEVVLGEDSLTAVEGREVERLRDWDQFAAGAYQKGADQATITIVEFGDYECPYCRAAEPHLRAILSKYPDDVKLAYRHFPISAHSRAEPSAVAAECAGAQGAFWPFHSQLYEDQAWRGSADLPATFADIAAAVGISDLGAFSSCLGDPGTSERVASDKSLGYQAGVQGTPTFLVNGRKYVGALDSLFFDEVYRDVKRGR